MCLTGLWTPGHHAAGNTEKIPRRGRDWLFSAIGYFGFAGHQSGCTNGSLRTRTHPMTTPTETHTRIILDSITDGVFTVDLDWRITSFNRAAEMITGISRKEAIGRRCWEVFRASICETGCVLRRTMETGAAMTNPSLYIVNAQGKKIPVSISTALLRDDGGRVIGAVETFRDTSVVEALRKELAGAHSFHDIISKNNEMKRLFQLMELVSESDATILVQGESGTGKELFARAIHSLSPRSAGPLVTVNCGALPDTLLESELFGYKAGAFTDAKKDKPGRLALAEKGTLFLDEIGDISPMLQVRLLRVLQERVYEPLGANRPRQADVRIVTATHRDLEALVAAGRFRQDLYYRINVVRLELPPLRKRREDIPLLADHFIGKFNRLGAREIEGLSGPALTVLMQYDYPGNVRELENIIEHASVVCRNGRILPEHLPSQIQRPATDPGNTPSRAKPEGSPSFQDMERDLILATLEACGGKRTETAARLGIHPTTLWRKMRRLDLNLPRRTKRNARPEN
jgi:PAS domain S-box-containing protein